MENTFRSHLCRAIDQLQNEYDAEWHAELFMPVANISSSSDNENETLTQNINVLQFVTSYRRSANKLYFCPKLFPPTKEGWQLLLKKYRLKPFSKDSV